MFQSLRLNTLRQTQRKEFSDFRRKSERALRRGYTLEVTPVPIPNTAVKLQRADDTARDTGGKVGRRDVK